MTTIIIAFSILNKKKITIFLTIYAPEAQTS